MFEREIETKTLNIFFFINTGETLNIEWKKTKDSQYFENKKQAIFRQKKHKRYLERNLEKK